MLIYLIILLIDYLLKLCGFIMQAGDFLLEFINLSIFLLQISLQLFVLQFQSINRQLMLIIGDRHLLISLMYSQRFLNLWFQTLILLLVFFKLLKKLIIRLVKHHLILMWIRKCFHLILQSMFLLFKCLDLLSLFHNLIFKHLNGSLVEILDCLLLYRFSVRTRWTISQVLVVIIVVDVSFILVLFKFCPFSFKL